jgi:hypothetical protein
MAGPRGSERGAGVALQVTRRGGRRPQALDKWISSWEAAIVTSHRTNHRFRECMAFRPRTSSRASGHENRVEQAGHIGRMVVRMAEPPLTDSAAPIGRLLPWRRSSSPSSSKSACHRSGIPGLQCAARPSPQRLRLRSLRYFTATNGINPQVVTMLEAVVSKDRPGVKLLSCMSQTILLRS